MQASRLSFLKGSLHCIRTISENKANLFCSVHGLSPMKLWSYTRMDESTSLNLGRILANVPRKMFTYPSCHQFPKNTSIFFSSIISNKYIRPFTPLPQLFLNSCSFRSFQRNRLPKGRTGEPVSPACTGADLERSCTFASRSCNPSLRRQPSVSLCVPRVFLIHLADQTWLLGAWGVLWRTDKGVFRGKCHRTSIEKVTFSRCSASLLSFPCLSPFSSQVCFKY